MFRMRTMAYNLPDPLPRDPMPLASTWLRQAWDEQVQPNPNAMVLATLGEEHRLSARVVLCKEIVPEPGYLVFYSDYRSRKGQELTSCPRAAAVFHWDGIGRQLRIEGSVVLSPGSESDDYFASRPWRSRVSACASHQSQPVASRHALIEQWRRVAAGLGAPDPVSAPADDQEPNFHVARPEHWGGYRLWADAVEFWVEGEHRLHDRARFTRTVHPTEGGNFQVGPWHHLRLQP